MNIPSISSISSQITSNIFSKVDTKNQGYIEKSDLTSALSQLSESSDTETNSDEIFQQIDSDGDGKITKSEMSKSIENLLSQLQSNSLNSKDGMQMPPPPDGDMPPPPPDGPNATNGGDGVTKEQATAMANDTEDSKLSSLMTKVSENFEAADSNQDGKVSFQEAMSYQEKTDTTGESASSTNTASTKANKNIEQILQQIIKAYGFEADTTQSQISTTA